MDCQIRRTAEFTEMVLVGSLDSGWSSYLSDRFDEVVRAGGLDVRVDMAGVSYLSSNGIGVLVRYHRQLRGIGGRLRIVADSEEVGHVLRLTGVFQLLHAEGPSTTPGPAAFESASARSETIERHEMTLQVFPGPGGGETRPLALMGDPSRLPGRGYVPADEQPWRAAPGSVALGLGALGPSFEACRGRFGEFLGIAGVAAYRPSGGPGRPDFEHAAGAFVPTVRVLHGLAFPAECPALLRFEARGEPGAAAAVGLSHIADACLDLAGGSVVGVVLAGECDGLVGAAIRRSPVGLGGSVDPFEHPDVRDWLSFTPEPEYARSTALVVGVAARTPGPRLARYVRPMGTGGSGPAEVQGHFHAAVVPYRPLPGGAVELTATVAHLFEPGRIEAILHLLGDHRPIVGAGESTFTRGVAWYVSLTVDDEEPSSP